MSFLGVWSPALPFAIRLTATLGEFKARSEAAVRHHTIAHIPIKAIERIALALMAGTADDKTLNLYKVIIHFQAAAVMYASQLQAPKSAAVQKQIQQMQFDHIIAALTALDNISFMTSPSLLLVQVLVTGVSHLTLST